MPPESLLSHAAVTCSVSLLHNALQCAGQQPDSKSLLPRGNMHNGSVKCSYRCYCVLHLDLQCPVFCIWIYSVLAVDLCQKCASECFDVFITMVGRWYGSGLTSLCSENL